MSGVARGALSVGRGAASLWFEVRRAVSARLDYSRVMQKSMIFLTSRGREGLFSAKVRW